MRSKAHCNLSLREASWSNQFVSDPVPPNGPVILLLAVPCPHPSCLSESQGNQGKEVQMAEGGSRVDKQLRLGMGGLGEWRGGARKAREKAGRWINYWGVGERAKEKRGSFVETVGIRRAGNRRILKWKNKKQETVHIRQDETSNLEVRSITKSSEHWEWFGRAPMGTELGNQRDRTIHAPGELVSNQRLCPGREETGSPWGGADKEDSPERPGRIR